MKKAILFILLILVSCKPDQQSEPKTIDEINSILTSKISLEEKYDKIYESGLIYRNKEISLDQQKTIGEYFFLTFPPTIGIEILPNDKINLSIEGSIENRFKSRHFEKYTFHVSTIVKIGKKNFTSEQLFEYNEEEYNSFVYKIHHKILNDIEAAYGNEELIWLDKSYLNYKPTECRFFIELVAENKVGEMCKVIIMAKDFTMFWENSMYHYRR